MFMGVLQNDSINNLHALYKVLTGYKEKIAGNENHNFNSIQCESSVWPNLIYSNKEDFLSEHEIVAQIAESIDNKTLPALIFVNNKIHDYESFKKSGFYVIDQWTLMEFKMNESYVLSELSGFSIGKISSDTEVFEWVSVVSQNLFSNKKIDKDIFIYLMSNNCELFFIRNENKIVGTTLVYYDLNKVAGIYMVSVSPEFRRFGLAKLLMKYTLNCIKQNKAEKVILQSTKAGLPLYKKLEFSETGTTDLLYKLK